MGVSHCSLYPKHQHESRKANTTEQVGPQTGLLDKAPGSYPDSMTMHRAAAFSANNAPALFYYNNASGLDRDGEVLLNDLVSCLR